MTLDDWRSINYFTADINAYALFIVCGFSIFLFTRLSSHFKLIAYYLIVCTCLEILAKIFLKKALPQEYFSVVNHFYVIFEAIFIGLFILKTLTSKVSKILTIVGISSVLMFQLWALLSSPILNSEYSSAFLASVYSVVLLFSLFEQSQKNYKGNFLKIPSVIVSMGFLFAYALILILFWFLPMTITYSRILANVMIIIKNSIGVLFYVAIAYAIWKTSTKKSFQP